jgi:hypothetical protein
MAWELDPDFALQSRLTFGRRALYLGGWLLVGATLAYVVVSVRNGAPGGVFPAAGMFFLLIALPYAALQILALEPGGRLDQRRLTGRSAAALGAAMIAGSAWMTLALGVVLIGCGWMTGHPPVYWTLAATMALSAAAAVRLLVVPLAGGIDRSLLTGLLAGLAALSTLVSLSPRTAFVVWLVSMGIAAISLPHLVWRFRHAPRAARTGRRPGRLNPLVSLPRTESPEFARALLTAGDSTIAAAALIVLVAVLMTVALRRGRDDIIVSLLVYVPLVVAGYECGARARLEHRIGGVDRLRLASRSHWRQVFQLAAGFGIPFVAVSAAAAVTLAVIEPARALPLLFVWPASAGLFVFWGLAEGLRGRKPGLYLYIAFMTTLAIAKAPNDLLLLWLTSLCAVAVPAAVAARSLDRGGTAPLEGGTAAACSMACGVLVGSLDADFPSLSVSAGMMSLGAGLFVSDRIGRPLDRQILWNCAAAALGASVLVYWTGEGLPLSFRTVTSPGGFSFQVPLARSVAAHALVVASFAGAGLLFGVLAHQRFGRTPGRSLAARGVPLAITSLLMMVLLPAEGWLGGQTFQSWLSLPITVAVDLGFLLVLLMAIGALAIGLPHSRAPRSPS